MPQPTQQCLVHILLLWTTILSIIQLVFVILFFRPGHHDPYQNSSTVAPQSTKQSQEHNTSLNELFLGKGQMLTFKARQDSKTIKWIANVPTPVLISEDNDGLTIKKDGYYFLSLQVNLKTCKNLSQTVSLKWLDYEAEEKLLLQGWINTNTCSTGLLGKVEVLPAGGTLKVTFDPSSPDIDDTEYLTHLDIIYIQKP